MRVLSKHFPANRHAFGLNELLYDVLVCATSSVPSAKESASLTFLTRGIWAVESEFARDSRQALYDFNKLVLAATENKLFVGPQTSDEGAFLAPLLSPAARCTDSVFAALLPHPSEWNTSPLHSHAYRFLGDRWIPL